MNSTGSELGRSDGCAPMRFFPVAPQDFRQKFDRQPFVVTHNLTAAHPLFSMTRLRRLAQYLRAQHCHVHYDSGDVSIEQRWDSVPSPEISFDRALERIEHAGAWIFLKQVEKDPEYGELLRQMMAEVSELSGRDIQREHKQMEAIIFLTSPRRITSYHIDRECNFLLQVSGEKQIHLFDREDREILPEEEIEMFWAKDNNAARYRQQYQGRAQALLLQPGRGVHIPVNCPHWLQNGDSVSISFSVSFQFPDSVRKHVYQTNYYLRRLGLNPLPPGVSPMRDSAKRLLMGSALRARDLLIGRRDQHW